MKKILQYGALFCSQSVSLEHCSPYFAAPAVVHKLQHSTRKSERLRTRSGALPWQTCRICDAGETRVPGNRASR